MTTESKTVQGIESNGKDLSPTLPQPPDKTRAPKRPAIILIKEAIDKLSNTDLKDIVEYCDQVKKTRKAKAEAEAKELE